MATLALNTSTTLARRWLPRFGGAAADRRCPDGAPPRRSILAMFAQGMAATAIPSAMVASPSASARPAFAPTLLASDPAKPAPDWQAAQQEALTLAAELRQARAALEQRIGPRGLIVGSLAMPGGGTAPIHLSDPENARRFWRRLPHDLMVDRQAREATVAAVRAACDRWDAQAERSGLGALERRAAGARDRARARLRQASGNLA